MSVTCLLSNTANDLRCPVCGQGFLLFGERTSATARQQLRRSAQQAMRQHHAAHSNTMEAHPSEPFAVEAEDTTLSNVFGGLLGGALAGAAC